MKNATIIFGFITVLLITTTVAFKLTHLPGAGVLLTCTGILLSVYYALHVLDLLNEKNGTITKAIKFTAVLCLVCVELGITFRINHWPFANLLLVAGLLTFSLVLIPQFYFQATKAPHSDIVRNISGALALMCFGLGVLLKLEHWPGAPVLLAVVPVLLLVYFAKYIKDNSIAADVKHRYLRSAFMVIVVGSIISLYFVKSMEIHDADNVPENEWYQQTVAAR